MSTVAPVDLLAAYAPSARAFDELLSDDGQVRDHWQSLLGALDALGGAELSRRRNEVQRLLATDGVTYTVYDPNPAPGPRAGADRSPGELSRAGRAWSLDPVPLLLGSEEWAGIEADLTERAELLNLVLADLYGPRDLIRRGLLPPELVYGHRGFLRAADQVAAHQAQPLFLYGADLARGVDGDLWVIDDLAQAPSGAGYALENRSVISRVFPSLYRDAQVHRIAPFFRALRASLTAAAPEGIDDPRVVILTPGPLNETYFEHAYLSTQLGYTLVEASDLTVRDGFVWLRSLSGLERVDVIIRRVDGWYCDPLELKADSRLGVPGLLEACRRRNVTVVNPIGSSVLENPGLVPFLPRIAEHYLGHELGLPSPPTWWCGADDQRSHVLANLSAMLVKPIARRHGRNTVVGASLSRQELADLAARIEATPHGFVGQAALELSTVPTLTGTTLSPRHAVLRTFAVAHEGSYRTMPGGLTRVAPLDGETLLSNQSGALNKDTWVLASEPEAQPSSWLQRGPVETSDPDGVLPSRTAENLFWLGRYAERAEAVVRVVRVVLDHRNDFQAGHRPSGARVLRDLLVMLTDLTGTAYTFEADDHGALTEDPERQLLSLLTDESRPGTLAFSLQAMLDCATAVRDQLSGDTWLALTDLDRALAPLQDDVLRATAPGNGVGAPALPGGDLQSAMHQALASILRGLLAFAGLTTESMVRDPGWAFMDAGRRLERALSVTTMLRSTLVPVRATPAESLMLESVLVAAESIITYRRRYRSHARVETLLDLLLLDRHNPRSVIHQLDQLDQRLVALPRGQADQLNAEQRRSLQLTTQVRLADTAALATTTSPTAAGDEASRVDLAEFLDAVAEQLVRLAETIDAAHFTHLPAGQSMTTNGFNPEGWGEVMR